MKWGSPPEQCRRVCNVGMNDCPCYPADPTRRGCYCPMETWSTAWEELAGCCGASAIYSSVDTLSVCQRHSEGRSWLPLSKVQALCLQSVQRSSSQDQYPTVKNKQAGDSRSYLRWQNAEERNRLLWDWGGLSVAVLPI